MDPAQHSISHTSELTGNPLLSSTRALRGLHEHEIPASNVLREGHQHYTRNQSSKKRNLHIPEKDMSSIESLNRRLLYKTVSLLLQNGKCESAFSINA